MARFGRIVNNAASIPGEARHEYSCHPVDEAEETDDEEEGPPDPQDEEVLLVEEVVAEDAEEVALVHPASGGADLNTAGDLEKALQF